MSTVLVYSDDPAIRAQIRTALGRTPAPEIGRIEYVECVDGPAVTATVDAGGIDVAVLDGEAWPTGGMGLARQFKDEVVDPPATVLLVARRDDAWLAKWSRADAVLQFPIDPFALTEAVVRLLLARAAGQPAGQLAGERPRFGLRRG